MNNMLFLIPELPYDIHQIVGIPILNPAKNIEVKK